MKAMDPHLLRVFQIQVRLQCDFFRAAASDLSLQVARTLQSGEAREIWRAFYAVQNLLNAAANLSKALWGQRGSRADERKALRQSIGVTDGSPLRVVAMRNNYEHFDERLEKWWKMSAGHCYIDLNIGPPSALVGNDEIDRFRHLDHTTYELHFWGDVFDLRGLVEEVERIYPKVRELTD